jgi:hypothetical protein
MGELVCVRGYLFANPGATFLSFFTLNADKFEAKKYI